MSVPKKRTPLAVHRNKIKRMIREAWRLNKHLLYADVPESVQCHLFFIYTGKANPDYTIIEQSVLHAIVQLRKQFNPSLDA